MKTFYTLLFALLIVGLSACSEEEPEDDYLTDYVEPATAKDTTPIQVDWDMIYDGDMLKDQVIILEGYIQPLIDQSYSGGNQGSFFFLERRNLSNLFNAIVSVPHGSTANHMKPLPNEYYHDDLKVFTTNEMVAGVSSHVRIKGKYDPGFDPKESCSIRLMEIELIELFDHSVFEKAVPLTKEMVDKKSKKDKYVYVDAELSLTVVSGFGQNKFFSIKPVIDVGLTTAMARVGYWPGSVSDDPNAPFTILNINGEPVRKGDVVRFFGNLRDGSFYVEEVTRLEK